MPPPTPETALLNRLFESHCNPPPTPPLTSEDQDALQSFHFGLKQALEASTVSSTSTPSTSTLALEDDEIRNVFTSEKTGIQSEDDIRTPRTSAVNNGGNQPVPRRDRSCSVDELNPNAKPFVPCFLPQPTHAPPAPTPAPAPSIAPSPAPAPVLSSHYRQLMRPIPQTLPTLIPKWRRSIKRALSPPTNTESDHDVLSMIVVSEETWDSSEAMAELAQEFAWLGSEDGLPGQSGVAAAFAQEVYKKFWDIRGHEYAESFLWHIKEAVLGTYMSVWDPSNNPHAISYQWIPSPQYVRAAIALGAFIGDLFTRDMITCANITASLNMVMRNLVAFEHVEAIQALVAHAGPVYWMFNGEGSEGIRRFTGMLLRLADQLHDEMSVLNKILEIGEVKKTVGGIIMRCDMWLEQLQAEEALHESQPQELYVMSDGPGDDANGPGL